MRERGLTGWLRAVPVAAATAVAVVIASMWAWNLAMPELFGLPRAEFRQALGLTLLALLLGRLIGSHAHGHAHLRAEAGHGGESR